MKTKNEDLQLFKQDPNYLSLFYKNFKVREKLLLTGHSHQAWPDCSIGGQIKAWKDASNFVDDKWEMALKKAEEVRLGFSNLLEDEDGFIALGSSTHDLLVKLLSSLDFSKKNHIITTDSEFHTIRRQLDRLEEEKYIKLTRVEGHPVERVYERICKSITNQTLAIFISYVYFNTGQILQNLSFIVEQANRMGIFLVIDVYHALNVVPFSIKKMNLKNCFVVGGGYKYCQLGEGNAFLRYSRSFSLRPIITGWFSEWKQKTFTTFNSRCHYASGPMVFAGSTYDPTSHYRAAEVFKFFRQHRLTPDKLRKINQYQVNLIAHTFDNLDLDPSIIQRNTSLSLENIGGFMVFKTPYASELCEYLKLNKIYTDYRGEYLRYGPAPYLCDRQIVEAVQFLREAIKILKSKTLNLKKCFKIKEN